VSFARERAAQRRVATAEARESGQSPSRSRGEPLSQSVVCGTVTGSDRAYGSEFP
jgi:hypothetical protein